MLPGAAVESISAAVADGLNGNVVPPSSPPKAQGFGILKKLTFSVELVVTISLLLSWITAGFMMFDVVEYKGVTGKSLSLTFVKSYGDH